MRLNAAGDSAAYHCSCRHLYLPSEIAGSARFRQRVLAFGVVCHVGPYHTVQIGVVAGCFGSVANQEDGIAGFPAVSALTARKARESTGEAYHHLGPL